MSAVSDIHTLLATVEATHGVRVLYACESGSRAWGFPSATSDYDVRFIFAHPRSRYCGVQEPAKQISTTRGQLDIEGWDIRKALTLLRKMNPSLIEWLGSPIVYQVQGQTADQMGRLLHDFYSPAAAWWHYRHLARGNWTKYLDQDRDRVEIKKYLYVCRALLAAKWAVDHDTTVPVPMAALLGFAPGEVAAAILSLIEIRNGGGELGVGPRLEVVDAWIASLLADTNQLFDRQVPIPWEALDTVMWNATAWSE